MAVKILKKYFLYINPISKVFATKRYIWKAEFSMFHIGVKGKTNTEAVRPATNVIPVSVSGYFHAFASVGIKAKASPATANNIAISGEPASNQIINAKTDNAPQIKSKNVNFQ